MIERPSRGRLLRQTIAAAALAALATVFIVLPAEYGVDLTGVGRRLGLTALAAPQAMKLDSKAAAEAAAVTRTAKAPFRTDVLEIRLAAGGEPGSEIERKVWMEPGQAFVYAWEADGEVYSDFHGETPPKPKLQVMTYRVEDPLAGGAARAANGSFTAPMAGFHGWFFRNLEPRPLTIRVRLAGFYELRPYPPPT